MGNFWEVNQLGELIQSGNLKSVKNLASTQWNSTNDSGNPVLETLAAGDSVDLISRLNNRFDNLTLVQQLTLNLIFKMNAEQQLVVQRELYQLR